ncbi:MAG TPA: hypothetical protein VGJ97_02950 [Anaerolineaceae bacterium]|jgi:hypothetical protein
MLDKLTAADFTPYLNQFFKIHLESAETYALELISVQEQGNAYRPGGRRPFSLTFSNPRKDSFLAQGTYRLEHGQIGALDIFLVPLGPNQSGMRYEAIFS